MIKHYNSLDGLRGLAVILVVFFHLLGYPFFKIGLGFGWVGVQMFFVLSGFLITSILLKDSKYQFSYYIKNFYWRRLLRIFPLYYFYIGIVFLIYIQSGEPNNFGERSIYLLTYTYNYTRLMPSLEFNNLLIHMWSLSIEEQFYLIWPLLIYFLSRKNLKILVVALLILSPLVRYVIAYYLHSSNFPANQIGEAVYGFTLSHIDAFAIGGIIPIFNLTEKIKKPKTVFFILLVITLTAGLLNFILQNGLNENISLSSLGYPIANINYGQHIWSYTLLNILFGSLILLLIKYPNNSIFANKTMINIGKVSYGIYVYHFLVLVIFNRFISRYVENSLLLLVLCLALIYLISYLSYNLYEKQFLKYKNAISFKKYTHQQKTINQ